MGSAWASTSAHGPRMGLAWTLPHALLPDPSRLEAIGLLRSHASSDSAGSCYALVHYNLAVLLAEEGELEASMQHARMALEACTGTMQILVSVISGDETSSQLQKLKQRQLATLCLVLSSMLMSAR
jgi:hypothetical protein